MFVPRKRLVNAPAPRPCRLPRVKKEAVVTPVETPAQRGEGLSSAQSLATNIASKIAEKQPYKRDRAAVESPSILVPEQQKDVAASDANFVLNLWFSDKNIQVIDSRSRDDALPTATLLANILLVNGLLRMNLPAAEIQCWPLADHNIEDKSWAAAQSMMSDFLSARFSQKAPQALLLFGEAAVKAVLGEKSQFQSLCFTHHFSEEFSTPVYIFPSLKDILYSPDLKKPLWQAMHSLRTDSA